MADKISNYQKIIEDFLSIEAQDRNYADIEFQIVKDTVNHHYQLVEAGWYEKHYIYRVLFHLDIKPDGKIWILANNTDVLVAEELLKRGIPASDIVIAFIPPYARQHSGFAAA